MKKAGVLLLLGVMGCAVLVAAGPFLLSTSSGRGAAERLISGRITGSVALEKLELSWTGGQSVEGLLLNDADGMPVLRMERMENNRSLLSLVRNWKHDLGTTVITGLKAAVVAGEDGKTNLLRALSSPRARKEGKTGFVPVLPFATLEVRESKVDVSAPGVETVTFDLHSLLLELPGPGKPAGINLSAETRQGDLSGELLAEGRVEDLVDDGGRLQPVMAKVDLTVKAGNLPVEGIDRALGYRGRLAGALGRKLDLQVRTRATLDGFDVDLGVTAPNFRTFLKMALAGGRLVLVEKAEADFTATSRFVEAAARARNPESELSLKEDVPFRITLESLSLPFGTFDPRSIAFKAGVSADRPARLLGAAAGEDLVIRDLEASLETSDLSGKLRLDLASGFERAGSSGKATVKAGLSELFDAQGRFQGKRVRTNVVGELTNVPSSFVEAISGSGGLARELLGPAFNATFSAHNRGKERLEITVSVESPRLKGRLPLLVEEAIELREPASIRATVSPALIRLLQREEGVGLEKAADLDITIKSLSVPLAGEGHTFPNAKKTSLAGVVEVKELPLRLADGKRVGIRGLRVSAAARSLEEVDLSLQGEVDTGSLAGAGLLHGGPVAVKITARTGVADDGGLRPLTGKVRAQGSGLEAETEFLLTAPYDSVTLTSPLSVEWTISEEALSRLAPPSAGGIGVEGEVPLSLQLSQGVYPLRAVEESGLAARFKAEIPSVKIVDGEKKALGSLEGLRAQVEVDGAGGVLAAKFNAKAGLPTGASSGSLEAGVTLRNRSGKGLPDMREASLEANYRAKAVPTSLLALLSGKGSKLMAVAGERVDGEGEVRLSSLRGGKGTVSLRASSPRIQVDAGLELGKDIVLARPAKITLQLDSASYSALMAGAGTEGGRRFTLQDTAVIEAVVSELRWPRQGASGGAVRGAMKTTKILFQDREGKGTVGFEELEVSAVSNDVRAGLDIEMRGRVAGSRGRKGAGGTGGELQAAVSLSDYLGADGTFQRKKAALKADVRAGAVPVPLLDEWLGLKGLGAAALGGFLDVEAVVDLREGSGPLRMSAIADNGTMKFDGALKKGVLVMTRPLSGEMKVTEELGRKLLRKIHPIFETVSTSREPLRVEVAAEGFAVPLEDFHISKAAVPSIKVFTNRLMLKKGGLLDFLIPLAQSFGGMKGVGTGSETEVWFTTLNARIKDGLFDYRNRLDMLIDGRLHALSWGSVDLAGTGTAQDRSTYSLMLGLSASSLRKVLGTDRISEGEVFAIPLRGEEGGLDLKKTFAKAALDLGRVRGQYELSRKDPLLGAVVGTLAGEITGTRTGEIPPPSMAPLPWANLLQPDEATQPVEKPASPPVAPPGREEEKVQPEDVIREVLPDDVKGLFDLLRKKR